MAIQGLAEAKAAFKALEPTLRANLADAAEQTAQLVAFRAQQMVRHRYGILASHIAYTISRTTGVAKVGIGPREEVGLPTGRGTEMPTHVAHLIEFGHGGPHPAPAFPFMIPAAEGERDDFLRRVQDAGQATEQQMGALAGSGGLL